MPDLKQWMVDAEALSTNDNPAQPNWHEGVPCCSEDRCRHYDGKRCRLIGARPRHICEPTVMAMAGLLDAWADA